ncbi:phosphoglycerate mutase family protein [Asticcacaulis sp. EMRT-3]|uniref:phosphoglycerate mutase family protein n=1 Tax=Asticcacaulis sp. EMRT-3 TaxID=3040349 RepID=UPI0024AEC01D|nr:phosphoglycerate mutase family protein [Asticcacaulis sp. EMRT-3]MDI7774010.1 phosphoglycerate mutase family protein [Asticcacaulis sp. EMRT-3]
MRDDTSQKPDAQAAKRRMGAITLVRHGEPALSRRVKLDWRGYVDWWARYDEAGLLAGQTPPPILHQFARDAKYIYSSTLPRSIETARAICGQRPFVQLPELIEAPLPPPHLPSFIKLTPNSYAWGFLARVCWWYLNIHGDVEGREPAKIRARKMAKFLYDKASEGGDVLVLAHGFFNLMISIELKKMGYIKTLEEGFRYWGCRRYELRKTR